MEQQGNERGLEKDFEAEVLREILRARVYQLARRTPLELSPLLSAEWQNDILIKREDLQPIFSFKIRGAANKIAALAPGTAGVICASAGNHGQGVALAAQKLGIPARVVMPRTTPDIKIKAVARYGATVILHGDHYSEASDFCEELAAKEGATLVHPFDDLLVIAGQGTVGKEIFEDAPDVDVIFVPVGGGGLIAGIAAYIKALDPRIKLVGVEPSDSDAMTQSVEQGSRISLETVGGFADGVAVRRVGHLNYALAARFVDSFIRVSTDEICSAIHDIYRATRTIVEPAGALSWAGAKFMIQREGWTGKRLVTINSGANMNFQRLQFAAARALTGAGLETLLAVRLSEEKGALKEFCHKIIAGKSISEFNYRSNGTCEAYIFLGIATPETRDRADLHASLGREGYWYLDLTGNELAKEHIRHLVGGRAPEAAGEELYSFVFPERPMALANFLAVISSRWNISLFHYRSHGADYGRVLIAFEMQAWEAAAFEQHLAVIGYAYTRETENPAYRLFLQAPRPFFQAAADLGMSMDGARPF